MKLSSPQIGSMTPRDMKSENFRPDIEGGHPPENDDVEFLAYREDQSPLETEMIPRPNLADPVTKTAFEKHIKELKARGLEYNSEDQMNIKFQEVRKTPKVYLFRFKGKYGEYAEWVNGVSADPITGTQGKPSHLRCWIIGQPMGPGGPAQLEQSMDHAKKYLSDAPPEGRGYSSVTVLDWKDVKTRR